MGSGAGWPAGAGRQTVRWDSCDHGGGGGSVGGAMALPMKPVALAYHPLVIAGGAVGGLYVDLDLHHPRYLGVGDLLLPLPALARRK